MIVTTANQADGCQISAQLGIVRGIVVRRNNTLSGFLGGLRSLFGGNIGTFEKRCGSARQTALEMCDTARQTALDRMIEHARLMGADGIVAVRFDATEFSPGVTEVLAYGTAVRLSK